jgi:purine-nucleoside phosphorylase
VTLIRVGTTGAFPPLEIGNVVVALGAAGWTGFANVLGGGEPTAPTADLDVVLALRDAARAAGLTTHVGPIATSDTFYGDPNPEGVTRWGRRGYLSVEMETAALFLLAMRERAKGRTVRAGSILTVSDVLFYPDEDAAAGKRRFFRPPEDEVNARVDLTIGAALAAAAALGR